MVGTVVERAETPPPSESWEAAREGVGRRPSRGWWPTYLSVMALALAVAVLALERAHQPVLGFGLVCLVALVLMWTRFPKAALAATIALSLVGDLVTVYWYPFTKNFSSHESLMYLAEGVAISPFEVTLVAALVLTVFRNLASGRGLLRSTPLMRPILLFTAAVAFGLAYGQWRGGDTHAALFEARPVIYLPLLYVLVVNVCDRRRDYHVMMAAAVVGIATQAMLSVEAVWSTPVALRPPPHSIMEHGSAISMNLAFALLIAMLAFRHTSRWWTLALAISAVPMAIMYFESQRRAAAIALVVGLIVLAAALFWRQRPTFWKLIPALTIVLTGYIGAMWGSESAAAFPAQAVKSVIAPDDLTDANRSSSEYRDIENYNLNFTIRTAPLTGIGFGHPFYRPVPLADISVFEYHEYIPHNSLLWIWTKTGFIGFATFLYLIARTLTIGAHRLRTVADGAEAVASYVAVAFVAMYAVFMYVDISWGARNAVLLALCMGLCTQPFEGEPDDATVAGIARQRSAA
jgi:hypothetical protein